MSDSIHDYHYAVGKRKPGVDEPVLSNEKLQEIRQSIEKYLPQSVNRKGTNMNDYKELIGDIGDLLIAHPSEILSKRYLKSAADAIEQLVKERDELYMEVMDCTKKIGCKAIEQVKKERDALRKELENDKRT